MKQKRIIAYLVGSFAAAVALAVAVFLVLIIGELVFPREIRLVISTGDAEQVYNGSPLACEEYEIAGGELREGDTLSLSFTGHQTVVGVSQNVAVAEIRDENGVDVTERYAIEFLYGELRVTPREIRVASEDGEAVYDGNALTRQECGIVGGTLVDGHSAVLQTTGRQIAVGKSLNYVNAKIYDATGRDVTDQYQVKYTLGTLTVTPRKITITSASATKAYDGTPLKSGGWNFAAGTLCTGQSIEVKTGGEQTMVGESENVIVHLLIYEEENGTRKDVTSNYEISCYYGMLTVRVP